jgi:hypothetical protein
VSGEKRRMQNIKSSFPCAIKGAPVMHRDRRNAAAFHLEREQVIDLLRRTTVDLHALTASALNSAVCQCGSIPLNLFMLAS